MGVLTLKSHAQRQPKEKKKIIVCLPNNIEGVESNPHVMVATLARLLQHQYLSQNPQLGKGVLHIRRQWLINAQLLALAKFAGTQYRVPSP